MSVGLVRRCLVALVVIGAVLPAGSAHADDEDYYPPNPGHKHVDVGGIGVFPVPGLLIHGPAILEIVGGPDLVAEPPLVNGSPNATLKIWVKSSFVGVATVYYKVGRADESTSKTYKLVLYIGFPHCDNPVEVCPPEIPDVGIDVTTPTLLASICLLLGGALVTIGRRRDLQPVN